MKPTNSPTQGQPNPRRNRFKVAFGPLFTTANSFSWVGIGFVQGTDDKKLHPYKFSANTPLFWAIAGIATETARCGLINHLSIVGACGSTTISSTMLDACQVNRWIVARVHPFPAARATTSSWDRRCNRHFFLALFPL